MVKNNVYYELFASITVPNPEMVGYWVDLAADAHGNIIKFFDKTINRWVKLTDASSEYATPPYIGNNHNWYIDDRDTGINAVGKNPYIQGDTWWIFDPVLNKYVNTGIVAKGLSAYDLALKHGFVGTEEEWIASLSAASEEAAKEAKEAADAAIEAAETATEAIARIEEVTEDAQEAADRANLIADNPPKIVDGQWFIYDELSKEYKASGINAVGDPFTIQKTYTSILEMEADYGNVDIEIGQFVWINTGNVEDEADSKLYLKGESGWILVGDLSGQQGIQGMSAYKVAVQNGFVGTEAEWVISLSKDSKDAAALALDAKAKVEATEAAVVAAEAIRVTSESSRVSEEVLRVAAETNRESNETTRQSNEVIRETQETARQTNTTTAIANVDAVIALAEEAIVDTNAASSNASDQAARAKEYADNPPKIQDHFWYVWDDATDAYINTNHTATGESGKSPKIQDDTWWIFNLETGEYENTNISVSSSYELTKAKVEVVLTGDITSHNHDTQYNTKQQVTELLDIKAAKSDVLLKDNITEFTPTLDYQPATKKYVDDNAGKVDLTEIEANIAANTAAIGTKENKVAGKGLSTNDYTTVDSTALAVAKTEKVVKNITMAINTEGYKYTMKGGPSTSSDNTTEIGTFKVPFVNTTSGGIITVEDKTKLDGLTNYDDTDVKASIEAILTSKGSANGIATLDENGSVPSSQLPSYVDDVLEYDTLSEFPIEGEAGKIYLDKEFNLVYRWSGTVYVAISSSLALGETTSTAYAGDKGKANADNITTINTKLVGIEAGAQVNKVEKISARGADIAVADKRVVLPEDISVSDTQPTGSELLWIDTNEEPLLSGFVIEDAPKDDKVYGRKNEKWEVVVADIPEEVYLDIDSLFYSNGEPLTSITEESRAIIDFAYLNRVTKFVLGDAVGNVELWKTSQTKMEISISKVDTADGIGVLGSTFILDGLDLTITLNSLDFLIDGDGEKALFNNGRYHEVPKEAPIDGKLYGRKDKLWSEVVIPIPDVSGQIEVHNTSNIAHTDIRNVLKTSIDLPVYDPLTYKLTFTNKDGQTVIIDLPIESIGLTYDSATKEMLFTNADKTISRISLADFVDVYVGGSTDNVIVTVEPGNIIKASLTKTFTDKFAAVETSITTLTQNKADKSTTYTKTETDTKYQGKLTAGDNITITNNVISSSGGGSDEYWDFSSLFYDEDGVLLSAITPESKVIIDNLMARSVIKAKVDSMFINISFEYPGDPITIFYGQLMSYGSTLVQTGVTLVIDADLSLTVFQSIANVIIDGKGDKALMDNGLYDYVPLEAPNNGKQYARKNKGWVEVYTVELVNVSLVNELGQVDPKLVGAKINVKYGEKTVPLTWNGSMLTEPIPINVEYTVEPTEVKGYITPSAVTYVAKQDGTNRNVSFTYTTLPLLSLITFDKSISDPANITVTNQDIVDALLSKCRRCLVKKTAEGKVTICYLKNDDSNFYQDGTTSILTGGGGNVMVYKPAFWYKYKATGGTTFGYQVSEFNLGETFIHSPECLIGTYKAHTKDGKLYSHSGVMPIVNQSIQTFKSQAAACGTGYQLIDYEQHCMIALLFYLKYHNRNSQSVIGTGSDTYDPPTTTGNTNSIGNADTVKSKSGYVNFLGIEGVFGGISEWISGVDTNDYICTIKNIDGTTRAVTTFSSTGWIKEITASVGPYFDIIPAGVNGSETTFYSDYYEVNAGSRVLARSYAAANAFCGVSSTSMFYDSSNANSYFGSRLAFRGQITEEKNTQTFKNLPLL